MTQNTNDSVARDPAAEQPDRYGYTPAERRANLAAVDCVLVDEIIAHDGTRIAIYAPAPRDDDSGAAGKRSDDSQPHPTAEPLTEAASRHTLCAQCGRPLPRTCRADREYCGGACRMTACRARNATPVLFAKKPGR